MRKRQTPSKRYLKRLDFVEMKLDGAVICDRCDCTLRTFAEKCSAGLSEMCQGFMAIDAAKEEFDRSPNIKLARPHVLSTGKVSKNEH